MTSLNAKAQQAKRAAENSDGKEALIRYLAAIFPQHSRQEIQILAEHQIVWLEQQGFQILPKVVH